MRAKISLFALLAGIFAVWAPAPPAGAAEWRVSPTQLNTDLSAAAKRKKTRPAQRPTPYQPIHRGFADPSIAPDGRPYRVPEYLKNQCHIDDGYGRFSPCSNRG